MARPKKNKIIEKVSRFISSDTNINKDLETKDNEIISNNTIEVEPEATNEELVEKQEDSVQETVAEQVPVEETQNVNTEVLEPDAGKTFVEDIVYTNDNQPKDTTNFKPVKVMSDDQLDYYRKRSEIIIKLMKQPQYKFLSKVALTKIADIYMTKKY